MAETDERFECVWLLLADVFLKKASWNRHFYFDPSGEALKLHHQSDSDGLV